LCTFIEKNDPLGAEDVRSMGVENLSAGSTPPNHPSTCTLLQGDVHKWSN